MVSRILLVGLALMLVTAGSGTAEITLPDGPGEGWAKSDEERRFVGSRLYDHIDGGAELFHEFGFTRLLVQEYQKGEDQITLEVYEMESPESALGIYLQQSAEEKPVEGIEARNSGGRYQLSVVKGKVFFQVNSFSGAEALLPTMTALAQRTLEGLAEKSLADEETGEDPGDPWRLLPKEGLVAGSQRLIRGQFGLQPIFTFGEGDILQLGGRVFAAVADYRVDDETTYTRIMIEYPSAEAAEAAYKHLTANLDEYLEVVSMSEARLVFRDYKGQFGTATRDGQVMELRVRLPVAPADE